MDGARKIEYFARKQQLECSFSVVEVHSFPNLREELRGTFRSELTQFDARLKFAVIDYANDTLVDIETS